MRSEATAAAEFKGKMIMNDPFAMRPFFGYNFGNYLKHWLNMEQRAAVNGGVPPKIFHVNWFRKDSNGKFMWPGFGENARVLDWVLRRINEEECYQDALIGRIPDAGALRTDGLDASINFAELYSQPRDFWSEEVNSIATYFDEQVGTDLPHEISNELNELKCRIASGK